jgi:hypothetical protein
MRWEGILIDPIGAALAIVVLDAVIEDPSPTGIALGVVGTFAAGLVVGLATSAIILAALRNRLLADHLQAPATLAAVIGAYAVANELRPEAGLVAATVLGMAFANQRDAPAAHIVDFNQYLGVSVLGVLFVVLGARVELDQVVDTALAAFALLALLVVVARPIAVTASTVGTKLQWRERAFLMAMAPRGVVAAAVASLFAIELAGHDIEPGPLVPVVFSVVVGTVLIAGLSARLAARRLRVAQPDPKGVALIGGGPFAVDFADRLSDLGIPTLHVGLEEEDADLAAGRGQLVFRGRLDSEEFPATVDDLGIAHAVALSGNDHLDGFATDRIASVIGSGNLYGLHNPAVEPGSGADRTVKPQAVLPAHLTADRLHQLFETGVGLRHQLGESHAGSDGDEIWLTICRVDAHLNITFDSDPGVAGETDTLIQLGPIGPIEPGAA